MGKIAEMVSVCIAGIFSSNSKWIFLPAPQLTTPEGNLGSVVILTLSPRDILYFIMENQDVLAKKNGIGNLRATHVFVPTENLRDPQLTVRSRYYTLYTHTSL